MYHVIGRLAYIENTKCDNKTKKKSSKNVMLKKSLEKKGMKIKYHKRQLPIKII